MVQTYNPRAFKIRAPAPEIDKSVHFIVFGIHAETEIQTHPIPFPSWERFGFAVGYLEQGWGGRTHFAYHVTPY